MHLMVDSVREGFPFTTNGGTSANQHQSISPHVFLLPYLGEDKLFARIDIKDGTMDFPGVPPSSAANAEVLGVAVSAFLCPSDPSPPGFGGTNYRASLGIGPALHGHGKGLGGWERGNGSGAFVLHHATASAEFRDGLENTVLFGEKLIGDRQVGYFTPYRDYTYVQAPMYTVADAESACVAASQSNVPHDSYAGTAWLFGGYRQTWFNHVFGPNSTRVDCGLNHVAGAGYGAFSARSFHPGGVNVVMAGGSARFVSEQISLPLWRALGTRAGGDIVESF